MWSRTRNAGEVLGVHRRVLFAQATDDRIAAAGQDGGLGTALLLYAIENGYIDAALVSHFEKGMLVRPGLARTSAELLACAGSRYTYSPNLLAFDEVADKKTERLGVISVGCQTSMPAVARTRGATRLANRFALVIGLLCSRTFDERFYEDLLEADYGVERHQITKVNIKGRLQVWYSDTQSESSYLEVPLSKCREFTRSGCLHCPDFAAEHADISLGGIGKHPDRTLVISRSAHGDQLLTDMESDGWITVAEASAEDPDAVSLIHKMAASQRRRWPIQDSSPTGAPAMLP